MIAANEAVARRLAEARVPCLYRVHERPDPERIRRLVEQLASLGVSTPPVPDPCSASTGRRFGRGDLPSRGRPRAPHRHRSQSALLACACARSSRPATRRSTSVTRACIRPATATSPPQSAAIRSRLPPRLLASSGRSTEAAARVEAKLAELGEWTSEREREAAKIEHKGDDIAACSLLEQVLLEGGYDQVFQRRGHRPDRGGGLLSLASSPSTRACCR